MKPTNFTTKQSSDPQAQTPTSNLKTLVGAVERLTFQSEETGYTVARLLPDRQENKSTPGSARGNDNLITVVGTLPGVVL